MRHYRQFLSLGGGVQSTALFLMSLHGKIDNPCEAAIFADTGAEKQSTYETIEFLREYADGFGIPVYSVSNGDILTDTLQNDSVPPVIPFRILRPDGSNLLGRRQCTTWYKITPIQKKIREITHCTSKNPVVQQIGISVDEAHRMRPSRSKSFINRYPLVEKRFGRDSCVAYLKKNGFDVPSRSSCFFCPYNSDAEWQLLNDEYISKCSDFEKAVQSKPMEYLDEGCVPYLHRSFKQIADRPFDKRNPDQLEFDLKSEECEGGCFL